MDSQIFALLSDRGSLTGRFKQVMGSSPRLTRLNQGHQFVSWPERLALAIAPRQMALVREIKMSKGKQDWLFARTIVPDSTLKGSAKRIAYLKEAPIGKILFGRNGAQRTSMQVSLSNELPPSLLKLGISANKPLWQRISIFEFPSGPLMVTEVFLPDCPIYQQTFEPGPAKAEPPLPQALDQHLISSL